MLYCMHVLASNCFPGCHPSLWCRNCLPLHLRECSVLSAGKLVWRPKLDCQSKAQAQTLHPCCLQEEWTSVPLQNPVIPASQRCAAALKLFLHHAGEAGPPGHCGAHPWHTHHSAHGEPPAVSATLLRTQLGCAAYACVCRLARNLTVHELMQGSGIAGWLCSHELQQVSAVCRTCLHHN